MAHGSWSTAGLTSAAASLSASRVTAHPSPRKYCTRSRCFIRSRSKEAAERLAARREHSAAIIAALKPWLEAQLSRVLQKSQLAEDIRYTLGHWHGLIRFLDDGTLELDTNPVENQIRPIALTRKNALFAGNETGGENWAMLASLVATCKMSDVNQVDYLAATLRAILDGHPQSSIEDLMPWRFNQPSSLAAWGDAVALTIELSGCGHRGPRRGDSSNVDMALT